MEHNDDIKSLRTQFVTVIDDVDDTNINNQQKESHGNIKSILCKTEKYNSEHINMRGPQNKYLYGSCGCTDKKCFIIFTLLTTITYIYLHIYHNNYVNGEIDLMFILLFMIFACLYCAYFIY